MLIDLATPADDPDLRRLLREGRMGDRPSLTLEREPAFFPSVVTEGDRHETVVVRRSAGQPPQAMGTRAVRTRYVAGQPERVPYLGSLRAAADLARSPAILRRWFAWCRELRSPDEAAYSLTSIVAENEAARRLFERGIRGLPAYRPLGHQVTLLMPVNRRPKAPANVVRGSEDDQQEICTFLQEQGRRFAFHPAWTVAEFARLRVVANLAPSDFLLTRQDGVLAGCAAVWDQRPLRQTVIGDWGKTLSRVRPALNAASSLIGFPQLPKPGDVVANGFLSHLAVRNDDPEVAQRLLAAARLLARDKGLDWLAIGLGDNHPLLPALAEGKWMRRLGNVIYVVCWRDEPAIDLTLMADQPMALEVATL